MANDWGRIKQALDADESITEGRRREIWRWTELARDWLDATGIDILTLTAGGCPSMRSGPPSSVRGGS